jgi:hypothetical protein
MPERTVDTAQGEVSYETVICQSCGDEVAKEGAIRCVIGAIEKEKYWSHKNTTDIEFDGRPDKGWLCDFCHENPAAYPHRNDKVEASSDGVITRFCKWLK